MAVQIDARIAAGLARVVMADAKAMEQIVPDAAVRAARAARQSLRRQIKALFGRHAAMGGKPFPETIPAIPQKLVDVGNGRMGAVVRTKAYLKHRRSIGFDLFWMFENAPRTIVSGRARMLAIPLPGANLPFAGRGATRKIPWPRDLIARGWKTKIIPAGRGRVKDPIIMGGPPGTKNKDLRPLYVLKKSVTIKKRLNLKATADKFGARIPRYTDAAHAKVMRRFGSTRKIAA